MLCYVLAMLYQSSADLHPKPFSKQTNFLLLICQAGKNQQLHNPNYYSIPILLTHNTILRQHEHRELNPFLYLSSSIGIECVSQELITCPDQVSCFLPEERLVITTSTAWNFMFLGGTGHTLQVTSSPSIGTYSPSILDKKERTVVKQIDAIFFIVYF